MMSEEHPLRRLSDKIPAGIDPHLYVAIENSLKLDNLLGDMKEVKAEQKEQGRVVTSIVEQRTIEKSNAASVQIGEVKFLLRVILVLVAAIPGVAALMTLTHYVW